MKSKEYLLQIQKLDKLIENRQHEKERWEGIATSSTARMEGERVQSSGSKQKMADAVCEYMSIEDEIDMTTDDLKNKRREIIKTIERLDADEYDVLHKMYVGIVVPNPTNPFNDIEAFKFKTTYLTLDEVSALNGKAKRTNASIHGRALVNLQKILDERE